MPSLATPRSSLHRRRPRGFTLLEIVVVVTIIALLATLVAPKLLGQIGNAKLKIAKSEVESIAQQVSLWMTNNGHSTLPNDFDLEILAEGDRPVLKRDELLDPWENPYVLINPGVENYDFDIVSYGADGQAGGEGENVDIVN